MTLSELRFVVSVAQEKNFRRAAAKSFVSQPALSLAIKKIENELSIKAQSLIIPLKIDDNQKVLQIQKELKEKGFLVGAIRQPTVKSAIIRLIARIDVTSTDLKKVCQILKSNI